MSWAETKKINGNLNKSLDTLIGEKTTEIKNSVSSSKGGLQYITSGSVGYESNVSPSNPNISIGSFNYPILIAFRPRTAVGAASGGLIITKLESNSSYYGANISGDSEPKIFIVEPHTTLSFSASCWAWTVFRIL